MRSLWNLFQLWRESKPQYAIGVDITDDGTMVAHVHFKRGVMYVDRVEWFPAEEDA